MSRMLLIEELQKLYFIENMLIKKLPELERKADDKNLKNVLAEHTKITQAQSLRLKKIFEQLSEDPEEKEVKFVKEMISDLDTQLMTSNIEEEGDKDLIIIMGGMGVEHMEMAKYISTSMLARKLGEEETANLLDETRMEEEEAAKKLEDLLM